MKNIISVIVALFVICACSGEDASVDPRVAQITSGELSVDFIHVYADGGLHSAGMQVLSSSGSFEPMGPTIIFVIRDLSPEAVEDLKSNSIKAEEHTVYLLREGQKYPSIDAMKSMSPIESVDPSMSIASIKERFKLSDAR